VGGVVRACGPDFVEEEKAGLIDGVMEIVLEAAFFFASGSDKRADFGFQQKVLALFGAQDHDQSDFGKVVPLGEHLRPDQDAGLTAVDTV